MSARLVLAAVLGFVLMLPPLAIDLYLPGLPSMAEGLRVDLATAERTVAVFLLGFAVGQFLIGTVVDAVGRRRSMLLGLAGFAASSTAIAVGQSADSVLGLRAIQALCLAATAGALPIVRDQLGDEDAKSAISAIMGGVVVAPLVAPPLGGLIVASFDWRATFLVLAVFSVLALAAVKVWVPRDSEPPKLPRPSALLSGYYSALSDRTTALSLAAVAFAFGGLFAFVTASPAIYMVEFGLTPAAFGLLFGINAGAMLMANIINAWASRYIDARRILVFGAMLMALSAAMIPITLAVGLGLFGAVPLFAIFFIGIGFVETNGAIVALSVKPRRNGAVAALMGALQFGVGAVSSFVISEAGASVVDAFIFSMLGAALIVLALTVGLNICGNRSSSHES